MELIILVALEALLDERSFPRQRPAIDFEHLVIGHAIVFRIEVRMLGILLIAQVAQHKPTRVADFSISFAEPVEQFVKYAHIFDIAYGAHKEARDFRAPGFDEIVRIDADPF